MAARKQTVSPNGAARRPVHRPNGANGADSADSTDTSVSIRTGGAGSRNTALARNPPGIEWLAGVQHVALQSAVLFSEALINTLRDVGRLREPLQLMADATRLVNNQLDALMAQQATWMQQLLDSEVLLNGQVVRQSNAAPAGSPEAATGQALLQAWGKAQDEWLNLSRSWIDAGKAAGPGR